MSTEKLITSLSIQKRVVHALFLRELKTRFGTYRLGYLWALLEPIAHLSVLLLIFGYVMSRAMPYIPFTVFLLNGLIPWFVFSGITSKSLTAVEANKGLFSYRPVLPIDAVLSRAVLELMIYFLVYIVLMAALWLFGTELTLVNMPKIVGIYGAVFVFSLGLGLVFMVIGHAFPESQKLIPLLIKPLYFLSGIMFSISIIPVQYHKWVDWNPLMHAFELLRQAVVPSYQVLPVISYGYLWVCAIVMLSIGLMLYKGREPAMLRS